MNESPTVLERAPALALACPRRSADPNQPAHHAPSSPCRHPNPRAGGSPPKLVVTRRAATAPGEAAGGGSGRMAAAEALPTYEHPPPPRHLAAATRPRARLGCRRRDQRADRLVGHRPPRSGAEALTPSLSRPGCIYRGCEWDGGECPCVICVPDHGSVSTPLSQIMRQSTSSLR